MSDKNYTELTHDLTELQDALDSENNPAMRTDIETQITEVKALIADYDLSDDDLFQCERCPKIDDIENSHRTDDGLVCDTCH